MKDNLDEKIKQSFDTLQMSEESRERILGDLLSAADSAGAEDAGRALFMLDRVYKLMYEIAKK